MMDKENLLVGEEILSKKILIISDCLHAYVNGKLGSRNHVFVKQMNALISQFETCNLCAPLDKNEENIISTYRAPKTDLNYIALPIVGGNSLYAKLRLIGVIPLWFLRTLRVIVQSDIVYQRFPNNVNLFTVFIVLLLRKKRFATYTGTWDDYPGEPYTYRLQKLILRLFYNANVFIYWPDQSKVPGQNLINSYSPSLYKRDLLTHIELNTLLRDKLSSDYIQLATVGSLSKNKNQIFSIKILHLLLSRNIEARLAIIGSGSEYNELFKTACILGVEGYVDFKGSLPIEHVLDALSKTDFLIQSPFIEGFGKVPIEALSRGVIPILSNTPFADKFTCSSKYGYVFDLNAEESLERVFDFITSTNGNIGWRKEFLDYCHEVSRKYTIERWIEEFQLEHLA